MPEASLAGRRILVTAGPTWVRLDAVRHIGNFSTGRTGLVIAREAAARGAAVTLLLGPGRICPSAADRSAVRIQSVVTFDDLHHAVREHVAAGAYDAMIHTAAVSDYRPVSEERGKIPSGEEELVIRLRPTPKIVDEVKRLDPSIFLVKFKLEVGRTEEELLRIARQSRERSDADLIVANDLAVLTSTRHPAYLLDREQLLSRVDTTAGLAQALLQEIAVRLGARSARAAASARGV
jgi:phosphopantothenoylcysteine synthetase/decarboxylase